MQFAQIPGQTILRHQLINAYNKGKVAHAQLFTGNSGTAAFPMALAYATYLMCSSKREEDSCGSCPNCVRMQKAIHPDVHWYFPKVAASDSGKYDNVLSEALPLWRSFITDSPYGSFDDWAHKYNQENKNLQISRQDSRQILKNVSMRAVEGGYKIIFIWGAELMHPAGANAILKILEEPPEKTIYLLVAFNYDAILQTILSRTQLISVPPNTPEEIQHYLINERRVEDTQALQISKISQGRIGTSLRLLQSDEKMAYTAFRDWMLACWNRDYTRLVRASEDFSKTGKADQRGFLSYSLSLVRNAVLKIAGSPAPSLNQEEDQFIEKYANRLGTEKLAIMYDLLNEAMQHLERNSNPRITHLNLSLTIVKSING